MTQFVDYENKDQDKLMHILVKSLYKFMKSQGFSQNMYDSYVPMKSSISFVYNLMWMIYLF